MPAEFPNPVRHQELLETLAGQVHRDLIRQYPDVLWKIRQNSLPFEALDEEQKALTLAAAKENLEALIRAGVHIELPHTPERDLRKVCFDVETLLKQGEPIFAYDLVRRARRDFPDDVSLRQLQALALIRTGAPGEALAVLIQLLGEGHRDQGTLAPLARAYRDYGERLEDPAIRRRCQLRAFELYDEAYRANRGIWSGLHAAWLALELGFSDTSGDLASLVELGVQEMLERSGLEHTDPFWLLSIQGIAALLQGQFDRGIERLQELAVQGRGRPGDLSEVRYMAQSVMRLLGKDPALLDCVLPEPNVIVFAGHMIDFQDRKTPRFPPELTTSVERALRDRLAGLRVEAGFATAACGAPLLFHEALQRLGVESHVVLPYAPEEFLADSVAIREDMDWTGRFKQVLEGAHRLIVASPQRLDEGSVAFSYTNLLLLGLGKIRAHQLRCDLKTLVFWDGQASDAIGSISKVRDLWRSLGCKAEIIDLRELNRGIIDHPKQRRRARITPQIQGGLKSRVMVMLFADVVHFSQLQERQIPRFVAHFMGAIGELEKEILVRPVMKNTWGDGLFLVFGKPQEAIRYGRALVDRVNHTDWASLGLPADLNLRVALHAGPVYVGRDPVTGRRTCYGNHVNNAARIEPITPPGKIYVSQAFAALAAALGLADCACEYVGELPLAKDFGRFPMYVLQTLEDPIDFSDPTDPA